MFAIDFVFAVALMTAPVEAPDLVPPEAYARLQPTLQALAVEWEILDPREVRYVMARPEDFAADLKLLRRRYHELADAPPLLDHVRFPDRSLVSDLLAFNRTYRQHLDGRQALSMAPSWDLQETVQETDRLYQIWDSVRDAGCDYYYVTVRRTALKRLRDLIGANAYCAGHLPPHVPLWRFQQID